MLSTSAADHVAAMIQVQQHGQSYTLQSGGGPCMAADAVDSKLYKGALKWACAKAHAKVKTKAHDDHFALHSHDYASAPLLCAALHNKAMPRESCSARIMNRHAFCKSVMPAARISGAPKIY